MILDLVLYAPNVHTGGGWVLLQALLNAWPDSVPMTAFLDGRARARLVLPLAARVSWVAPNVGSRLNAEFGLLRASRPGSTVLCFHGLPPLLPNSSRVVVFQQNRNYLGLSPLSDFAWRTRLRLGFERFVSRAFRRRVSEYVVQTPAMQRAVAHWYRSESRKNDAPTVRVLPFIDALPATCQQSDPVRAWDFVYVSDGEAHKNHRALLAAWLLLAEAGLRPSLALTLGPRDSALKSDVAIAAERSGVQIRDLGQVPRGEVMALYANSRALIFPSKSESFGLPLVEAANMGLPIIAAELDYVRDVCIPVQTFDPDSPVSIARAVRRFLSAPEPCVTLRTPTEFWNQLLSKDQG